MSHHRRRWAKDDDDDAEEKKRRQDDDDGDQDDDAGPARNDEAEVEQDEMRERVADHPSLPFDSLVAAASRAAAPLQSTEHHQQHNSPSRSTKDRRARSGSPSSTSSSSSPSSVRSPRRGAATTSRSTAAAHARPSSSSSAVQSATPLAPPAQPQRPQQQQQQQQLMPHHAQRPPQPQPPAAHPFAESPSPVVTHSHLLQPTVPPEALAMAYALAGTQLTFPPGFDWATVRNLARSTEALADASAAQDGDPSPAQLLALQQAMVGLYQSVLGAQPTGLLVPTAPQQHQHQPPHLQGAVHAPQQQSPQVNSALPATVPVQPPFAHLARQPTSAVPYPPLAPPPPYAQHLRQPPAPPPAVPPHQHQPQQQPQQTLPSLRTLFPPLGDMSSAVQQPSRPPQGRGGGAPQTGSSEESDHRGQPGRPPHTQRPRRK